MMIQFQENCFCVRRLRADFDDYPMTKNTPDFYGKFTIVILYTIIVRHMGGGYNPPTIKFQMQKNATRRHFLQKQIRA